MIQETDNKAKLLKPKILKKHKYIINSSFFALPLHILFDANFSISENYLCHSSGTLLFQILYCVTYSKHRLYLPRDLI